MPDSEAFARVTVIYPLALAPSPSGLGEGWHPGAWPVAFGAERLSTADRARRWHEPTAIRRTLAEQNRTWRADSFTGWEDDQLTLHAIELVSVPVENKEPSRYLLVHLSLLTGARGAVGPAMNALADLVRLESNACKQLPTRLSLGETWELDTSFLRATHLVAVVDPAALPPAPRVAADDPATAWLVAGANLPAKRENRYPTDIVAPVPVVPGVRGYATPQGVSLVADSSSALRDRDLRGQCADALLLAVLQRDALLRLSRSLAELGAHRRWWKHPDILEEHAQFRGVWWHPVAVDHPAVRAIGGAWRETSGSNELMRQVSEAVADLHADVRARRSELVAMVASVVALLALGSTVLGWWMA